MPLFPGGFIPSQLGSFSVTEPQRFEPCSVISLSFFVLVGILEALLLFTASCDRDIFLSSNLSSASAFINQDANSLTGFLK